MSTKIFAIKCKATGEFISCNGHVAWAKAGNAENSFNKRLGSFARLDTKFDDQDEYELVVLTDIYYSWKRMTE